MVSAPLTLSDLEDHFNFWNLSKPSASENTARFSYIDVYTFIYELKSVRGLQF